MLPDKEELLVDITKGRYAAEMERTRDLDGKAGNLIGYVSIVTGLIVGLGTFSILEKLSSPQYYIPYLIGIGGLLVSIILSLLAVKITSTWLYSPGIADLKRYYQDGQADYTALSDEVVPALIHALEQNFNSNNSKATKVMISWIFLVIGIGSLVIYGAIFALTTSKTNNLLVTVLVEDAIQAIQSNQTKGALSHLMLADKEIPIATGNSTIKNFIEDSIQALKNNQPKEALTILKMISPPKM
jgi:hypothetical protein